MHLTITYINPAKLAKPKGYSHAVSLSGDYRTVLIGGQNATDKNGKLVGGNSLRQQTEQVLANIETIVEAAGGRLENVVKLGINILQGQDPREGFQAFQSKWSTSANPPAITVLFVAGLGSPDWLVEIDAVAVVPQ
jgi:enamine deaminase RidA (YjgF/YER057c/UK114 family)